MHLPHSLPGQASASIPGAIQAMYARDCTFRNCSFAHLGSYGIDLTDGCRDVQILGCEIRDLGAGGVKIWHGCSRTTLSDNHIAHGGILYPSAVGVLIGQSGGNKVIHNHIADFAYTGVSVGWSWGYDESHAFGNIIEYNHIHDIGRGMLSDMGGIYTLGVSPGTRIRHNIFHDITSRGYGGWAIYTDEGSTDILIENNLSYRTNCSAFHQHYGRDNLIQNNIWAYGREHQLALTRREAHRSFVFRQNIVLFEPAELLDGALAECTTENVFFGGNLYYRVRGSPPLFGGKSFEEWQALGFDRHSLIADPCFVDPANDDFRLQESTPALAIGFRPFDLSGVGPRPEDQRV